MLINAKKSFIFSNDVINNGRSQLNDVKNVFAIMIINREQKAVK